MANRFWNFVTQLVPGTLAKAEDVNSNLSGINTGLDSVEGEIDQAIRVTNAPGTTNITINAATRALKIITFDASGNVVAVDDIGDWQGNHAGSTSYNLRDLVVDAAGDLGLNNVYRCNTAHTSTADMADNTAKWDKVIDVAAVEAAKVAAETAQTGAETAETNAAASETAAAASAAELNGYSAIASSATPTFSLTGNQTQEILALTHNPAPILSNHAAGQSITVIMTASGAARTITYDADWTQIGVLPTSIPDGKSLLLSFISTTALDTGVYVCGAIQA